MLDELLEEMRQLKQEVKHLQMLLMKDRNDTVWMKEDQAAETIGMTPRWLRRNVKDGIIPIEYRSTNNRHFEYKRKSIEKFKQQTAISN